MMTEEDSFAKLFKLQKKIIELEEKKIQIMKDSIKDKMDLLINNPNISFEWEDLNECPG